jgi:hypothetical protein
MYPRIAEPNLLELTNSIEGKDLDIKNIIKLINEEYKKPFKNPFLNIELKNSFLSSKIKKVNHDKKNNKKENNKKKPKNLTLKEYIDFYNTDKNLINNSKTIFRLKTEENERHKLYSKFINLDKSSNAEEDDFFHNMRDNGFLRNLNVIQKRKIFSVNYPINQRYKMNKNSKANTTRNNLTKKIIKRNTINSSINYITNNIIFQDKTIQTNSPNKKLKNISILKDKNNLKIIQFSKKPINSRNNKIKENLLISFFKKNELSKSQFPQYLKKSIKKNTNKNLILKKTFDFNSKFLTDKKSNKTESRCENVHKSNKFKNQCINIFTLLSLKKDNIN